MKQIFFIAFYFFSAIYCKSQTAEEIYTQAQEISGVSKDELKQKIILLSKAIALKANYDDALILRAHTFVQQKSYKDAVSDYTTLIAIDSLNALYFKYRAEVYVLKGEFDNAISDYTTAYESDTTLIDCIYERGNLYNEFYKLKKTENAINDFNFCIKHGSVNIKAIAYIGRGRVMENMEEFDKAMKDYNTAIKVNPLNPEAYLYRGILKIALNQDGCYDLLKFREMNGKNAQDYLNKYCTK